MFYSHRKTAVQALLLTACIVQSNSLGIHADDLASEQNGKEFSGVQFEERKFSPFLDGKWVGQGVSYGPFREGQSPGGVSPTREELTEDLSLLAQHWNLMRMYGSRGVAKDVLEIIHEKKLPLRVMIGAWITSESESERLSVRAADAAKHANQEEVKEAIRLANAYPDEVIAVNVGNETQVYWSDHVTQPEVLIQYIREVRTATSVPVTTADDFNFWNKPESELVAKEVDFIVTHVHAMWAGLELSGAMEWTERIYREIREKHPNKTVVVGEAGWATQVHSEGEQAKLIKGKAGEQEQREYYREFSDWARYRKVCTFYFEAFDEPWKGGSHPNEVEKHWGVFHVDRTPKAALTGSGKTHRP